MGLLCSEAIKPSGTDYFMSDHIRHLNQLADAALYWEATAPVGICKTKLDDIAKALFETGGLCLWMGSLVALELIERSPDESTEFLAQVHCDKLSEYITCKGDCPIGAVIRCLEVITQLLRYRARAHG
jgi:hypothetical protein